MDDPAAAPHGGESIAVLLERVANWLTTIDTGNGRIAAVTHAAVIRAAAIIALDADLKSFWRIDIAPVSFSKLHAQQGRWTVHSLNTTVDWRNYPP